MEKPLQTWGFTRTTASWHGVKKLSRLWHRTEAARRFHWFTAIKIIIYVTCHVFKILSSCDETRLWFDVDWGCLRGVIFLSSFSFGLSMTFSRFLCLQDISPFCCWRQSRSSHFSPGLIPEGPTVGGYLRGRAQDCEGAEGVRGGGKRGGRRGVRRAAAVVFTILYSVPFFLFFLGREGKDGSLREFCISKPL